MVEPTRTEMVGVPVTVTASEKLTVTRMESPATYVLSDPADDVTDSDDTVATCVSYVIVVAELAVLLFAAESVNAPSATDTEPVPLCVFAVGVNTTVYDVPETAVNDDRVPPLKVMSATAKSVEASDKVKVNVDVSPDFSVDALAAIETEGA